MAKVIAFLQQKGGSGKTTLSTNAAVAMHREGARVALVDTDPQGSARDWGQASGGALVPVFGLDRETLPTDIAALSSGFDFIVIDGASKIERLASAAVKAADIVLIPVQPSPYDIWASKDLVDLIKARQGVTGGLPKAAFVISRAVKGTLLSGEVVAELEKMDMPVLRSGTTQRVAYASTAATGRSVFCDKRAQAAADEISAIMQEAIELL